MLLTITASRSDVLDDASDLGYLLHKHPDRLQKFDVHGGQAHVFYPEAGPDRCTAALLLEVDPVALVRGKGRHFDGFRSRSTSTTGRTPPRRCCPSRWARCSARR